MPSKSGRSTRTKRRSGTSSNRSRSATRSRTSGTRTKSASSRSKSASARARSTRSTASSSSSRRRTPASRSTRSSAGRGTRRAARSVSSTNRYLTDHRQIQQWAEERGASPACVRGTGGAEDVGMIRLDFPGFSGEGSLERVEWEEWFQKFDESGLALLVQDETSRGQRSNFNKLVSRDTAEGGGSSSRKRSGRSSGSRRRAA